MSAVKDSSSVNWGDLICAAVLFLVGGIIYFIVIMILRDMMGVVYVMANWTMVVVVAIALVSIFLTIAVWSQKLDTLVWAMVATAYACFALGSVAANLAIASSALRL